MKQEKKQRSLTHAFCIFKSLLMTACNYLSQFVLLRTIFKEIYHDFDYIIDPEDNQGRECFKKTVKYESYQAVG